MILFCFWKIIRIEMLKLMLSKTPKSILYDIFLFCVIILKDMLQFL